MRLFAMSVVALMSLVAVAAADESAGQATAPAEKLVLDTSSYWRAMFQWKTPVVLSEDGKTRLPEVGRNKRSLQAWQTAGPADGWRDVQFDDRDWSRGQAPIGVDAFIGGGFETPGNPAEVNRICVRGRFIVDDPGVADGLRLSLEFAGGAVVCVNGRELVRKALPAGDLPDNAVAEPYPLEAYLQPDGKTLPEGNCHKNFADRYALRVRQIESLTVPASLLRKGLNVVTVEIRRAAVRDVLLSRPPSASNRAIAPWPHAKLCAIRLTAPASAAIQPNVARPAGLQVWQCPTETVYSWDYGDPADALPSLDVTAVKNAACSVRIAASSDVPIRGLKVSVSELAGPGGAKLAGDAVSVRYSKPAEAGNTWISLEGRYDMLLDDPPAEVPVAGPLARLRGRAADSHIQYQKNLLSRRGRADGWHCDAWHVYLDMPDKVQLGEPPVAKPGAVQPVWLTVAVPPDAAAGDYRGQVTVAAEGHSPVTLPLRVRVIDWVSPEPGQFTAGNNFYNSVDSLARCYDVQLWSDRHWELIGQSLALSRPIGNKLCSIPLTAGAYNVGNEQGFVRWIKKSDGSYDHDFTIFDRYCDLYEKTLGKPDVVKLYVWGRYGNKTPDAYKVSLLDPQTGKVEPMVQPAYGTPESLAFWKPVMDNIRQRLDKRGWMDAAALAIGPDEGPDPSTVTQFRKIWPDGKWMSSAHPNPTQYKGAETETVPVPYVEHVWAAGKLYDPDYNSSVWTYAADQPWNGRAYPRPWNRQGRLEWAFPRYGVCCIHGLHDRSALPSYRWISESALQGNLNGIGNCGLDLWQVPGSSTSLAGNSHMGPAASLQALLGRGQRGPVPTERYEVFRHGMQVVEAIAFLQKALAGQKLSAGMVDRVERLLDERARLYIRSRPGQEWHWLALTAGADGRDAELFATCAEVARALAER